MSEKENQSALFSLIRDFTAKKISQIPENERDSYLKQWDEIQENLEKSLHTKRVSYPLTSSQMGIYFSYIKNPTSLIYNCPFGAKIKRGDIDVERMINAFDQVLANHAVFFSHIEDVNGVPSMVPFEGATKTVYKKIAKEDAEKEIKAFLKPFDLKKDVLARVTILDDVESIYILFDSHHIVFDGTSDVIFNNEVTMAYNGEHLPQEKVSLFDVSLLEEQLTNTYEYQQAEQFYTSVFDDFNYDNDFATNNLLLKEPQAGIKKFLMNGKFSHENIAKFTKSNGITANTLFLSAFEYTLAIFNGSNKALVCMAESGRHNIETIDTMGMLVKTIAIASDFTSQNNVTQYLLDKHKQLRELIANDFYPFPTLASKYGFANDFMFVYQPGHFFSVQLGDVMVKFEQLYVEESVSKISMEVFKEVEGYLFRVVYRKDLYNDDLVESFLQTYFQVLSEMMCKDNFNDFILLPTEQQKQLDIYNETEEEYEMTDFVTLFRRQVAKNENKLAVSFNDKKITYKELDEISESIASYIHNLGVGKNDVVSVMIPRCEYMAVATIGVLKSGAGYQPLDTSYPKERLSFMVKDASAKLLITNHQYESSIEDYKGPVLYIEDIPNLSKSKNILSSPAPDSLYVLLYTSGTTGVPKGVMIEHRNVVALYNSHKTIYSLTDNSRIASYPSYGFDAFVMDFIGAFLSGGTLYIVPEEIRLDILALDKFYIDNDITHGFMTTQVGRQFVELTKCKTLRSFMVGGEALVPVDMSDKNLKLVNGYGPSESIAYISSFVVDQMYDRVPIGSANKNIKLYVVDKNLQRLPIGVPGELLISGHQVGRGYLNRPEKTIETFIPNPFTRQKGYERAYRTGDVVRMLPNGMLDYIGRNDGQVKVRGFRIELTEVESVIRSYEQIKDVTVQAFEEKSGGKFIAAFVVSDTTVDVSALNDFILSQKPSYMVPAVTMQIESIPLNVNGKVDKKKLPKPEKKIENIVLPQNDMQQAIFEKVADVIGISNFGINTDIFYAGLTSIGSVKLNVLLSEAFNVVIQIRDLKENNTVEKLEQFILANSQTEELEQLEDYPLSKTQEGIFVECMSHPNMTIYNIPVLLQLSTSLNVDELKNAIVKAVAAHSYINTRLFYNAEGEIRQKRVTDSFDVHDIEVVTADSIASVKDKLIVPYNIEGDRLFRIKIIQAKELYLFVDMHHIISDGTSMNLFFDSISKAYMGQIVENEIFTGYEVALQEEKNRKTEVLSKARKYYNDLLSGLDFDFLPNSDLYKTSKQDSGSFTLQSKLEVTQSVLHYVKENNMSVNGLLCAAFGFILSKYNNTDYSVFSTVYNGRMDSRVSNTVSMLVKTLPVLCEMSECSPRELISKVSDQLMNSMANDIYSFAEISREIGVQADVMFIYQGDNFMFDTFCGYPTELISLPSSDEKAPIVLQVALKDGLFVYQADYDKTKFSEELILGMVKSFDKALLEFVEKPSLKDILILDNDEKNRLNQFNQTAYEYDSTQTVTDLFEEAVKDHPENIAIVYQDKEYTYRDLDVMSNKIASYIHKLGIGKDDFVSIIVPRNEYMTISAMGVVRSGAAYQPLDPTYPKDRLNFMVKDCGAKLLIADRNLRPLLDEYEGTVLYVDEIESLPETAKIEVDITPNNALVIIYTSGTTGTPKGCVLEHRNIVAFFHTHSKINNITQQSRIATYASFGFDGGVMDVFTACMAGASLYVIPDDIRMDLMKLDEFYNKHAITFGFMTTQVGRMFASSTTSKTLTHFLVGGEKLVPFNPPTNFTFVNGYGPSETMAYVTHSVVKDDSQLLPIGCANPNVKLYVTDKYGHLLPIGACGELCIATPQVARGYLNRPEKTQEVFVANPFSHEVGYERMYKTGDVVRLLPDGNYDFIGRRDGQVKVRGFRIELTEVECVIRDYEGIKNATVQAYDSPTGGKFVAAFIVADNQIDIEDLKSFIGTKKPPYMIPAVIMQIDQIPLNVNGKVDKRKLPKPELQSTKVGEEPKTEMEAKLCSIYQSVLGIDKVYADDDFFAIGGTSISAVQLIVKCNNAQIDIVYKNLFENSTPQKLAAFVSKGSKSDDIFAPSGESKKQYDYSCLDYNVVSNLPNIKDEGVGDVVLTGVTGFLGSHIFKELIDTTTGKVICLVRSKDGLPAETRMEMMMVYYFEDWYEKVDKNRVAVVNCDISDKDLVDKLSTYQFDTIINCAANVKHFDKNESLLNDNFSGVENLIELSQKQNARFVQMSSLSVSGESVNGNVPSDIIFRENNLNIGQSLENKYIYSKYLAEQAIIDATSRGKLRGKIIRLGNLMPRETDGEFQINSYSNGFLKQFLGYEKLGCYPVDMMDAGIEYSPIDCVAKAVVMLSGTPDSFTVFHAKNCHEIHYGYFINEMIKRGIKIDIVEQSEFEKRFEKVLKQDNQDLSAFTGFIAYLNKSKESPTDLMKYTGDGEKYEMRVRITSDTAYTIKALYRLGFAWPLISKDYLRKMLDKLIELCFFDR